MKTVTYTLVDGSTRTVEYDETLPCIVCGEPVGEASMGGTLICPDCDCGRCRYCGVPVSVVREELDNGRSLRAFRKHIAWHKAQSAVSPN